MLPASRAFCCRFVTEREEDVRVIFALPGGQAREIRVDDGESGFCLVGNEIKDDHVYAGPLFRMSLLDWG